MKPNQLTLARNHLASCPAICVAFIQRARQWTSVTLGAFRKRQRGGLASSRASQESPLDTQERVAPRRSVAFLRSGGVFALGQGGLRGAVAIYTAICVRSMTRSTFGQFAYLLAIMAILLTLSDGGLSRLLIRDIAREPTRLRLLVSHALRLRVVWTVLLGTTFSVIAWSTGTDLVPALLTAAVLLIEGVVLAFESASVGGDRPLRVAGGQWSGAVVLFAGAAVVLARASVSLEFGLVWFVFAGAAKLTWHMVAFQRLTAISEGPYPAWRDTVTAALPYFVLVALGTVYLRIDLVILHVLKGSAASAPYAAAYRFVDAGVVLAGVIASTIAPAFSRLHRSNPELVASEWRKGIMLMALVGSVSAALLGLFAHQIVSIVFGARYARSASSLVQILAPGLAFMIIQTLNAVVLFTSDMNRALLVLGSVQVAFNVVLTITMVTLYGATGAAIATTVSEGVTVVYYSIYLWRYGRNLTLRTASAPQLSQQM